MANQANVTTYVFSIEAVRRAIKNLVAIPIHEHFAGYLAILHAVRGQGFPKIKPVEITTFHDRFLRVDGFSTFPYVSPFKSRGYGKLAQLNPNVAGSYAQSSLRPGKPLGEVIRIDGKGTSVTYSLRQDHALIASKQLLRGKKVSSVSLAAFLFRDYGFELEKREISRATVVFRDQFGLRENFNGEAQIFNILFDGDQSLFADSDLQTI